MTYTKTYNQTRGAKKRTDSERLCKAETVGFGLVKALSDMRKACFKEAGETESDYKHKLAAHDIVILGKLINVWREIVGIQLASKTCPMKLFKGKLYLTVSDSQWMQTLLFIKSGIIQKLGQKFPDLKITEVIGRIGKIPPDVEKMVKDAAWPDWKEEQITEKFGVKDPELAKAIDECQQKLTARLRGLEDKGYTLCKICRANVTRSQDGICAMCVYDHRTDVMMKSRSALAEMPWLSYEEVKEQQNELTLVEYDSIKNELLNDTIKLVNELASDLKADYDEDTASTMRKEMIRGIVLFTGESPENISLYDIDSKHLPDKNWLEYLRIGEDEL